MAIERLSRLPDWQLVDESQDLRGRPLFDRQGNRLGTIEDLLIDTDEEIVQWVRLHDGRRVAAEALVIEEGGVFVDRPVEPAPPQATANQRDIDRERPASPGDRPAPNHPPPPGEPAP